MSINVNSYHVNVCATFCIQKGWILLSHDGPPIFHLNLFDGVEKYGQKIEKFCKLSIYRTQKKNPTKKNFAFPSAPSTIYVAPLTK